MQCASAAPSLVCPQCGKGAYRLDVGGDGSKIFSHFSKAGTVRHHIANTEQGVAQEVMDFLQHHLNARPDRPIAAIKFSDWLKLMKMLKKYGAKL